MTPFCKQQRAELRQTGVVPAAIILEPVGRNTAPALTLAALVALQAGDSVVVETPDAVLVAHMDNMQQVKDVVSRLKREGRPEVDRHRKI